MKKLSWFDIVFHIEGTRHSNKKYTRCDDDVCSVVYWYSYYTIKITDISMCKAQYQNNLCLQFCLSSPTSISFIPWLQWLYLSLSARVSSQHNPNVGDFKFVLNLLSFARLQLCFALFHRRHRRRLSFYLSLLCSALHSQSNEKFELATAWIS